ncbi:MAG TPA: sigma-70 family RNA polymerase sigma factor, partial [Candidatus Saccharimonadales bacterium]|nr:sigma-70 family RNA polymerase sigma factor [Candidatus Saccharimonadales bacterium]
EYFCGLGADSRRQLNGDWHVLQPTVKEQSMPEETAEDVSPVQEKAAASPPSEISHLTDHLFRHEAGKLVSVLTSIFGIERLQLAEDVVQEALVRALQTWPYYGVPKNPAAWLTQTAKNLALDVIRREKSFRDKEPQIISFVEQWSQPESTDSVALEGELKDHRLRLMFACCHPLVPQEAQTALALKTLCGFSPAEIAKAFLTTEAAVAKRLTRAKQKIQELQIGFEIPAGKELTPRLDAVLQTLYLLFNEGYKASAGENLVREELCCEAIRLATLLAEHPAGDRPRTHALVALMLFNAARLAARSDDAGNILLLKDQDRSRWDKEMIAFGIAHFGRSAVGQELSEYHLQAGIAACHCMAADYNSTDWPQILSLYDQLVKIDDSPVVALNRAVAASQVHGPQAGIEAVEAIQHRRSLDSYYLLYAVLAEFEAQLKNFTAAARHLKRAIELTGQNSERSLLSRRLRDCEESA